MKYLSISIIAETVCLVAALLFLRKDRLPWKVNAWYLLIVTLIEICGIWLRRHHQSNQWLYNAYMPLEAAFISFYFYHLIKPYIKSGPVIITGLCITAVLYVVEICIHGISVFNTLTVTAMSVVFIIYGLFYYYLLISDEDFVQLGVHPPFWWVTGTILFYFGSSACDLVFLLVEFEPTATFPIRKYIYDGLIVILYGTWTYSFLCRYRYNKHPSYSS